MVRSRRKPTSSAVHGGTAAMLRIRNGWVPFVSLVAALGCGHDSGSTGPGTETGVSASSTPGSGATTGSVGAGVGAGGASGGATGAGGAGGGTAVARARTPAQRTAVRP